MSTRRARLIGFRYRVGALFAEVRKSCRDELKILYEGGPFGREVWRTLERFGAMHVLEASKLNPKMKDVYRVHGTEVRLEGALGGDTLHVFFGKTSRPKRHAIEQVLEAHFAATGGRDATVSGAAGAA